MGYKHIEVKQVAGFIDAEINGVELARPLFATFVSVSVLLLETKANVEASYALASRS